MDVKATQPTDRSYIPATVKSEADFAAGNSMSAQQEKSESVNLPDTQQGEKQELTKEELLPMTQEMNKFFQYLNADIRFEFHARTNRLMVKVVDTKTDKVLREFPPHELLDKIANFREYVGVLLDKKA
jgi:flagellar protein FlaG